jgi:hypothetical protein
MVAQPLLPEVFLHILQSLLRLFGILVLEVIIKMAELREPFKPSWLLLEP